MSTSSPIEVTARPATVARLAGDRRTSLCLGLLCLLIYNLNGRAITAGDTYPARYLPFAIVKHHTVLLDPVAKVTAQGRGKGAFWMVPLPDGHVISLYPIVVPLLVAPLYVPAAAWLDRHGWSEARLDHLARLMEKLCASLIAAASASLLYLLLRRRARASIALLLTVAYAFGTTTWVISSQALWQHGMAGLLIIGALLLLTGTSTTPRAMAVGLLLGLIAANRPPDAILAAALGAYAMIWAGRRRVGWLVATSALPLAGVLLYNFSVAGNVLGGYGLIGKAQFFRHDLFGGLAGLLVSPTRGLLIFSPFLVFLGLAARHLPERRDERLLSVAMIAAVALQLVLYAKADWRGGLSWGPRYLTDLLPFLVWLLVPVVAALRGAARGGFLAATGAAILIQAIGAFCYTPSLDIPIFAADRGPTHHDMNGAWHWRHAPYATALREGVAPVDFVTSIRGTFDAIEVDGRATSVVTAGQQAFAVGWTLAGRATPWQVAIVIAGQPPGSTGVFFDRPDVRTTLGEPNPAGWRIPIDTTGMAAGDHVVTAFVWTSAKGEGYYLQDRTLTVRAAHARAGGDLSAGGAADLGAEGPDGADAADAATDGDTTDLVADARAAAERLGERQQADGSWLTAYTSDTRFADPRPEMNTFVTALLVDLLAPLATSAGLADNLERARRHLSAQIEADGLVRYHGRPDGPGIGTLGCAITPDTDDTALVWRIAPDPDRGRLKTALATIGRYRTSEGLYRTWLAPREAYQCLDPGRDPNPADLVIQMHLYLLLAEVRPADGRALCAALRSVVDEDRVWVYSRQVPLTTILRLPDVERAGCPLDLPQPRLQTSVPDQQIWMSVARLVAAPATPGAARDPVLVRAVLRELARDDFAVLRTNPPLLYHNDLTATVSRFYWSQDVGYALWLRLYAQLAGHHGPARTDAVDGRVDERVD